MSYLERIQAKAALKTAGGAPLKASKAPSAPFAGDGTVRFAELAPDLVRGLDRLQSMNPPQITRPEVWLAIVADAVRLARDGWASQALALGWHPLHLWGCSPTRGGNPDHDGLAVWIDGRRPLLLDETSCIVEAGPAARAVFNKRPSKGAIFLWDLGSGHE